jgi:hypothetical protein
MACSMSGDANAYRISPANPKKIHRLEDLGTA